MFSKFHKLPVVMVIVMLSVFNGMVFADQTTTEPAPKTDAAATGATPQLEAPAPAESQDARALTEDELSAYGTMADSTSQNQQVQEMNVGASINTTIVLSVLVALIIFAVLVAVL